VFQARRGVMPQQPGEDLFFRFSAHVVAHVR
jgi:hypothetical protein